MAIFQLTSFISHAFRKVKIKVFVYYLEIGQTNDILYSLYKDICIFSFCMCYPLLALKPCKQQTITQIPD